ncbi:MAG TPA: cupredoxin domain-containing protein [Actinomycetota bacterium]|nr:cupredoxin domain-containing protein [Actinomycetota bacterium]
MYQWLVFVHLVGVFGFLIAHGVSVGVSLRLRTERDPAKIGALLDVSSRSIGPMWLSIAVLLAGGIAAGFLGRWWGYGWIWASIGVLVLVIAAMGGMASRYYKRVRFITSAMAEGTQAVSADEYDRVLRSSRPLTIAVVGFAGLVLILWMMIFKPTFGLSPQAAGATAAPAPAASDVEIAADEVAFDTEELDVPAGEPFTLAFENRGQGVPHNVSIYEDPSASEGLFVGDVVNGPATITYQIPALPEGDYFFRCDVHPTTMTGTVEAD